MSKGMTAAVKKAAAYVAKHPDALTAEQLAKKFDISPSTVYRADWWKNRQKAAPAQQPAAQ